MPPTSNLISCAPSRLYAGGGFPEDDETLARLRDLEREHAAAITLLATAYDGATYRRNSPAFIAPKSSAEAEYIAAHYNAINRTEAISPASAIVQLRDATIYENIIKINGFSNEIFTVYETYRPNDRPYVNFENTTQNADEYVFDKRYTEFFIGSSGSFNYGHWLTDDLPRVLAALLNAKETGTSARIWLPSYNNRINLVREESIRLIALRFKTPEINFIPKNSAFKFRNIRYITPVTYHPQTKNWHALTAISNTLRDLLGKQSENARIFVGRSPTSTRHIANEEALFRIAEGRGFTYVEPSALPFIDQASLFAKAEVIVGCMGAAMTSSVFSAQSTKMFYLLASGWVEPYYWDLASVLDHVYSCALGPAIDETVQPHESSFSIDENIFEDSLNQLLEL